jgi:hypothetical protein
MKLLALSCESCGGSIAFPEGKASPECPFCGSTKQVEKPLDQQLEPPQFVIPFAIEKKDAESSFQKFARSSFWYPKDIRQAKLELKTILLPAWLWSGDVESHYTGLATASTRSGKRPISGISTVHFNQVLVPSSQAVTIQELNSIAPFEVSKSIPYSVETLNYPYEPGELTRRIALQKCQQEMQKKHATHIKSTQSALSINCSSLYSNIEGSPALVPVFIGVYRRKDNFYRIVVNGLNGNIIGEAPFDWIKLLMIIGGVILILIIFVSFGNL